MFLQCVGLRFVCGSFFSISSTVGYVMLVNTRVRKWEHSGNFIDRGCISGK